MHYCLNVKQKSIMHFHIFVLILFLNIIGITYKDLSFKIELNEVEKTQVYDVNK